MSDTIVLLYVGKSAGPFSVYGAQTKREYRVNGLGATLSVDERDAPVLAAMREFEPIEIAPADAPDSDRPRRQGVAVADPPSDSDSEGQDSADSTSSPTEPVNATDAAIALAAEAGIDLAAVAGTGADGRIVINDVRDAIAAQA